MKILIVEDEVRLAEALSQIMREQKYQTDIAHNGNDGLDYALYGDYDVIVLDVMLPGKDGFEVVKSLRAAKKQTPVIMLTARDDISDKIKGLMVEELSFDDLTLSLSTNDLCCGAKSIHLAFKEFEIMKILLSNQKTIVSKEMLISKVWGDDSDAEDNNVEAYISFLRKKLHFLGSRVAVTTIRKVGYRLEVQE